MAKIFGKDTYLAQQRDDHSAYGLFLIYVFFIIDISFLIFLWKFPGMVIEKNILALILLGVYFLFNKPINREIRMKWDYAYGLIGEESVEEILKSLPDSYVVFANVVLPDKQSNIDFVVVGPNGISTVEVKSHKGRISFDGQQLLRNGRRFEHNFLWQAKKEAQELCYFLRNSGLDIPFIDPLLVFSNRFASVRFGKKTQDGVLVIGAKWLLECIQTSDSNHKLSPEQITQIHTVLAKTVS